MNFSTIAMLLLAWQLLRSPEGQHTSAKPKLKEILSDDANNALDCVGKLSSDKASSDDKMGALFQLASNPAVADIVDNLFPHGSGSSADHETSQNSDENRQNAASDSANGGSDSGANAQSGFVNDEGFRFPEPSAASREFFRPIDNIADAEVKNKLYRFYDSWYIKK